MQQFLLKSKVLAVALIAFALIIGTVPARGDDRDEKCERRIHKAEENLERAVHRHGEHSRQADQRRHQLEEVRERCHHNHDRDHH